jgi:thiol-disulfide isomerase/thioredoxin
MKKFLPILLVVLSFSGFICVQILWNSRPSSASQMGQDKSKEQLYENLFKELKLTTTTNQTIELKSLKTPLVVVNFWASWCLPCLKEFPSLLEFQKKYGSRMTVIGINGDEETPLELVEKTSKKYGLAFPQVLDPKSEISDRFLITSYPYTVIYHHGKVVHISHKIQDFTDKDLIARVDGALSSK